MIKVIILTGGEMRHSYFRISLSKDKRFKVVASFCESDEMSLERLTFSNEHSSLLEKQHVLSRNQSEQDFFGDVVSSLIDRSNPIKIAKGSINSSVVFEEIKKFNPDILVCYGSSLIKGDLLEVYEGRFLNVHLGLSPYYRGSGTNVWPLINEEPWMVGATFMHIDSGIDTGHIVHQIQASIFLGDSSHTIGNRLILDMTKVYANLIANFSNLSVETQTDTQGKLYKIADFDSYACKKLYDNFKNGMIEKSINSKSRDKVSLVRNNALV
jgi:phosphoribosylglycinamide formyltransferase 1